MLPSALSWGPLGGLKDRGRISESGGARSGGCREGPGITETDVGKPNWCGQLE